MELWRNVGNHIFYSNEVSKYNYTYLAMSNSPMGNPDVYEYFECYERH